MENIPPNNNEFTPKENDHSGSKEEINTNDIYNSLKKDLLSGKLLPEDFRNTLVALDQATPAHEAAELNNNLLDDPEVIAFIENQSSEIVNGYHRLKSFTEFHIAQGSVEDDTQKAIQFFSDALESAKQSADESWLSYVQGTLLYMQGNSIPEDIITRVQEEKNIAVLKKLNAGLQKRGYPAYKDDYFS